MTAEAGPAPANPDAGVIDEIAGYLTERPPRSFFLFAGAGSGKTHTLVEVLRRVCGQVPGHPAAAVGERLGRERRTLAVITYTNIARDEVLRRLGPQPLVGVSTIHSFCWSMIEGFNEDIRAMLVEEQEAELQKLLDDPPTGLTKGGSPQKPETAQKAREAWERKVAAATEARDSLREVLRFTYSPDRVRRGQGALDHAQVLKLFPVLLERRPALGRLLAARHPIVLIDESQDTQKRVIEALRARAEQGHITLGLIGDHRQRVYFDGEPRLVATIPSGWARPVLRLNRRCPARVVELINAIWAAEITGRTELSEGGGQVAMRGNGPMPLRIFLGLAHRPHEAKAAAELDCAGRMAALGGASAWGDRSPGAFMRLTLEHQLAADRAGFGDLHRALSTLDSNGVRDNSSRRWAELRTLQELWDARSDRFAVMNLLRDRSPELSRGPDEAPLTGRDLTEVRAAWARLVAVFDAEPTLRDLVRAAAGWLLDSRAPLVAAAEEPDADADGDAGADAEPPGGAVGGPSGDDDPKQAAKWAEARATALSRPWSEWQKYSEYVRGEQPFGTHQGVKGAEFPRVMVVLDDEAAGGSLFKYERLIGVEPPSPTDLKNLAEGKETSVDRTLRLLYVACSRASESLALVIWTADPAAARRGLVEQLRWVTDEEVERIAP
ncbi:MAG: UvrD-helicase domain-containing protein [Myxococcales bacterium]|nr:UvrD-helicase domain-containing protein [Myxococcales bacterium]